MNTATKKSSLRNRLIFFSLCISLIPSASITSLYYFNTRYILKKHVLDELAALVDAKKQHIISCIEAKKERTMDFSSDGLIKKRLEIVLHKGTLPGKTVSVFNRHLLKNKKILDPSLLGVSITDTDGTIIASTYERFAGATIASCATASPDFRLKTGIAFASVSSAHYNAYLDNHCICISAPIFSAARQEKILGYIINYYSLDILNRITTDRSKLGETGEIYLVNKDKAMVTESRFLPSAPLNLKVNTEPVLRGTGHGKEFTGIYPDYRGIPVIGASAYIKEYGWTVLVEIDKAEAFAPLKTLVLITLTIGIVCVVAVTGMGIFFAFSTTQPINTLKAAVERFMAGDLGFRINIPRSDEIGDLAHSFNIMADKLSLEKRIVSYAVEQSPVAVIITDINGNIEYVNPKFTQVTQYTPDEILGENPRFLKSDMTSPEEYKHLWDTITSGKEWHGIFHNKKKNGDYFWASASISPIRKKGGDIINYVGIQEDITEEMFVKDKLKDAIAERDKHIENMKLLMFFSNIMNDEVREENLINHLFMILKERFRPDILAIFLIDKEKHVINTPLVFPPELAHTLIKNEVLIDPTLCRVIRTGREFIARDIRKEPYCECIFPPIEEGGCACYPLLAGGMVIGAILMAKKDMIQSYGEDMHNLMSTYAGLASSALHRIRLMEMTKHASVTDVLTGIYNRRFFNEMLEKQLSLAKRRNEPLSLLIADIDHFKNINDTYGHTAGDRVLQQAVKFMKSAIRSSDIIARYGGEEFAIIMPTTDIAHAVSKAEEIRQRIGNSDFDHAVTGKVIRMNLCIGVATFPEHGSEPGTLMNNADSALYKAKNSGRNQVVVATYHHENVDGVCGDA
ncbi:MAG TPA: diguanylate cyclase [Candidatus Brocadiaceae bacterium]|nr:diguanylate cyclase [Candidatus Brocadiaceae bacterium]